MRYTLLSFFILFSTICIAQSDVNVGGKTISNANYSFDYSIGQVATNSVGTTPNSFTQGFNQPNFQVTKIKEENSSLSISVYPNPTLEVLYIKNESSTSDCNLTVTVFDMQGRKVFITNVLSTSSPIKLAQLNDATYNIQIVDNSTKKLNQYNIVKISK